MLILAVDALSPWKPVLSAENGFPAPCWMQGKQLAHQRVWPSPTPINNSMEINGKWSGRCKVVNSVPVDGNVSISNSFCLPFRAVLNRACTLLWQV